MIAQKQFLGKLKDFGLNTYECKLWTALLSRGVSTAGELSDIADVPRSRSYDVLESLEKKGFIIMKLGKPIKYLAVPPKEVVERVKKRAIEEADSQVKILEGLKSSDVLDELNDLHTLGLELVEPADLTGSFRGRLNVYSHMEAVIRNAKVSIILTTSAAGLVQKYDALKVVLEKASKRGVKIRIAAPVTKETQKTVDELRKIADVRNNTKLKSRFCVADNDQLTFMITSEEAHPSYDSAVWVKAPEFAASFAQLFDSEWAKMPQ